MENADVVRGWLEGVNEPGLAPTLELSHEHIVTIQLVTGTSTHTGLAFDLRWAAVWKVSDGKVDRVQGYATKGQAMKAVGARKE